SSALNYQTGTVVLANGAIVPACQPNCANQVSIVANGGPTDLVMDIVGYFRAPSAPVGTITSIVTGTGLAGGPITSTGTISTAPGGVSGNELATGAVSKAKLSATGGNSGQTLGTDGTNLVGQNASGTGTVTSVGSGTGLTGGPITGSGSLALASSYQLPQSCANGQVASSNGAGGWTCGSAGAGTVTSVGSGTGLTGGPVTGAGSLALAGSYQLPQACASGQIPVANGSGGWTCGSSGGGGGSGTVTSVATGTGLTGGPITSSGTVSLNTTWMDSNYLKRGGNAFGQ